MLVPARSLAALTVLLACTVAGATEKSSRAAVDKAIERIGHYNRSNGERGAVSANKPVLFGLLTTKIGLAEVASRARQGKKSTLIHTKLTSQKGQRAYGADGRADPLPHNVVRYQTETYSVADTTPTQIKSAADLATFVKTLQ